MYILPNSVIDFAWFYISIIKSTDLLAFIAIILALLAYRKSVLDKYDSWKSLLESFTDELRAQAAWLAGYYANSQDKMWFSPDKIVYKISFESAKEILRRGISDSKIISADLAKNIAFFNERIEAFNQLLDYQKTTISSDPALSGKLQHFLDQNGLRNNSILFPVFVSSIGRLQASRVKVNQNMFALAYRLYFINDIIHNQLIGTMGNDMYLHRLHSVISEKITAELEKYDLRKPFFTKNPWLLIVMSLLIFLLLESLWII